MQYKDQTNPPAYALHTNNRHKLVASCILYYVLAQREPTQTNKGTAIFMALGHNLLIFLGNCVFFSTALCCFSIGVFPY